MSKRNIAAEEALARLKEGNLKFVSAFKNVSDTSLSRRAELCGGQHPYAVIISCSDSRVVPEYIFFAGL